MFWVERIHSIQLDQTFLPDEMIMMITMDDNCEKGGNVDDDSGRGCRGGDVDVEDNIQVPCHLPDFDYDNDHHDNLIKVMLMLMMMMLVMMLLMLLMKMNFRVLATCLLDLRASASSSQIVQLSRAS